MPRRRGAGERTAPHLPVLQVEGRPPARSNSPLLVLLFPFVETLQEGLAQPLAVGEDLLVARAARLELDDLHVARSISVRVVVRLRLAELVQSSLRLPVEQAHHIRKMPKVVSGIGALSAAEMPNASTRRVSSGSMIPSS